MGRLTNDELKQIIKRASILQRYHEQSLSGSQVPEPEDIEPVFEIGHNLDIKRHFIKQALLEYEGIPIDEPVIVDTHSFTEAEIQGYANGPMDGALLNEIRAQLEYHFNTVGAVSRRKGNIYWNAKPAFPAKLFATTRSPELEIKEEATGRIKLTLRQNLKTYNKLFLPAMGFGFGGFMMLAALMYDIAGNDTEPMFIFGSLFILGSMGFARFIRSRKLKKKRKLKELVETIQQIMERRFRAGRFKEEPKPEIEMEDFDEVLNDQEEIEIRPEEKIKS
ncbi:MAG: hypothetical protein NXI08_00295 [bacterium]|nr:hypothetical protein [bacterium]